MKKAIGAFLAGIAICVACGTFPAPARAQTNDIPASDNPAANAPAADTPTAATSEPVPLSTLAQPTPAAKKTLKHRPLRHHRQKHVKHLKKSKHHSANALGDHARIRTAQISLSELSYDPGPSDGVMGLRTKAAIKAFQRDHHLHVDGMLGPITYDALIRETGSRSPAHDSAAPPPNFYATHPDFYGYTGTDYANPTAFGSPQAIPTRFGTMELDEQQTGQSYQYSVMLNGKNVFHVENQAAPINISRTFSLDNADAIVITSYANGNAVCPYQHALLVVQPNSNGLHPIQNCTRSYQAYTEAGNLIISFPEDRPNAWSSGSMWRYENGTLVQF